MKLNPRCLDTSNILQLAKSLALIVKNQVNPPNPERMNTLVFLRLFMDGVLVNNHVHNLMVLGQIQSLNDLDASLEVTIAEAYKAPSLKPIPAGDTWLTAARKPS